LYITGYGYTASAAGASLVNPGLVLGLVVYVGGGAIGWWSAVRTPARGAVINLAALLYGGWIGIMAACAAAMAWVLGGHWWVAALGGLSFVISDFLIGVTEIRGRALAYANDWVWLTYVAGQMGIIYAAWL